MSDVFISYSRKDIAFARILHEAFKVNAFETWIDWQDIPPSTEWLAEVYEAIEKADTFVFLISQASVESEVCGLEVAHAVKNNKRLIPVVINDVDPKRVSPELAALNWLFFRSQDEYSQVLQDLIQVIQTDYAWIKEHTRLQVRALEWERHQQEGGYLLRGGDLEQAEQWLARSADKQTQPTALQTQYLLASRRAATRRQQVTLGGVLIGLAVAVVLGIVAWNQRNEAVTQGNLRATSQANAEAASTLAIAESQQRATAEWQAVSESHQRATAEAEAVDRASIARSRELAIASSIQLEIDQELALLLAIEASREAATSEAAEALRQALVHRGRTLHLLLGHEGDVFCANWDPEGKRIASAGEDGTARVWDAESGKVLLILEGHTGAVVSAVWDASGTRLATAGADGTARVWDAHTGDELLSIEAHQMAVNAIAWSPDSARLVTGGEAGYSRIWDAVSGSESVTIFTEGEPVTHAAWNNDGSLIAAGYPQRARVWDADTGEGLVSLAPKWQNLSFVAWSNDGARLVTGGLGYAQVWNLPDIPASDGDVLNLDSSTSHEHAAPAMEIGGIRHASWNNNDSRILSVSGNGTAEIWDTSSGESLVFLIGHTDAVNTGAWGPDQTLVATASDDGTARIWEATSGIEAARLTGHRGPVYQAAWDPGGARLVTASADGSVRIWAVEAVDPLASLGEMTQEFSSWNPDGSMLITGDYGSIIWDAESGTVLATFEGFAAWKPAGEGLLTAQDDGYVRLWNTDEFIKSEGEGQASVTVPGDSSLWSPDGGKIVTVVWDGNVRIWDAANGEELAALPIAGSENLELSWSPDGSRIASIERINPGGEVEYQVQVWDAATGSQIGELPAFVGIELQVAWDPGGSKLVTVDNSETAQVWDANHGVHLLDLIGHSNRVDFAAWSPDGKHIVTTSLDNTARIWDASDGTVLAVLNGHLGGVSFAAWNPDGTAIATASFDRTARIWDAQSGSQLAVIGGYIDAVRHAAWSPDGARLVVTSWGGPVRTFDIPLVNMQESACRGAVRNMSELEWAQKMGNLPYRETCPEKPKWVE